MTQYERLRHREEVRARLRTRRRVLALVLVGGWAALFGLGFAAYALVEWWRS